MSDFERAAPWLQAALDADGGRGLWTLDDVKRDLEARKSHLWMGDASAMVTTISDWANGERLIESWLAGGELNEIMAMTPVIEGWARRVGCTQAHVQGRRGWVRALSPQGYSHYATTLRKLLV